MALSLGMALAVEEQRTRLTWPLPCLFLPWFLLLTVIPGRRLTALSWVVLYVVARWTAYAYP